MRNLEIMTPDILQTSELPTAKELFATLEKVMTDDSYFLIENFPEAYKIKWPGIQFEGIDEEPDVISEKGFVILKTPTSGLPLSIIHPNPEVYKVKVAGEELSVHYIIYEPLGKWDLPPLFLCKDKHNNPQMLTRNIRMLSLENIDPKTLGFLDSLKNPRLEETLIDKAKFSNWAEFLNYVLKNKLVIPINSIPLDSTQEKIWDVYMNDILPTVAGLLYAQAFIEE